MQIPVFLSTPKSYLIRQERFISELESELRSHELSPLTLGRSDYDMNAPLDSIRRLMAASCGLVCIALRRTLVTSGTDRPSSDNGEAATDRSGSWLTSAYSQIEPAMAYQIGLPIMLWREEGVTADGVFDRGAIGQSMPSFNLDNPPVLTDTQWRQPLRAWIDLVRAVHRKRGEAPRQW